MVELPSVIVPEETIVLINAQHPGTQHMRAWAMRRLQYNLLFRGR